MSNELTTRTPNLLLGQVPKVKVSRAPKVLDLSLHDKKDYQRES